MPGLVIVAVPSENDPVWKYSSEEVPHLTLYYLGDVEGVPDETLVRIEEYLDHVVGTNLCKFGLEVDRRGELGEDKADVLFFNTKYTKKLQEFRNYLLMQPDIRRLYDSAEQYPGWTPHLTMGYPETPAKPDDREYPGFSWVNFDLVALWTGDFEGPTFRLDDNYGRIEDSYHSELDEDEDLAHQGVKGMKWGVRKDKGHEGQRAKTKKIAKLDRKFERRAHGPDLTIKIWNGAVKQANANVNAINNKPKYKNADLTRDTPLRRAYYKEGKDALVNALEHSANSFGTNASGTKKYGIIENHDQSWDVIVRDVKHAADVTTELAFPVTLIKDDRGFITGFELQDSIQQSIDVGAEFLEHYGIKGMQWGVRKSLSKTAGKASSGNHPVSDDHANAVAARAKIKAHGTKSLSNQELQSVIGRTNLEAQYSNVTKSTSKIRKGHEAVKNVLAIAGTVTAAVALVSSPAGKLIRTGVTTAVKNGPGLVKNGISVFK